MRLDHGIERPGEAGGATRSSGPIAKIALLGTEGLLLALRFDGGALEASSSRAAHVFAAAAATALPLATSIAAALVLLGSGGWREELACAIAAPRTRAARLWWPIHGAALLALYGLSIRVFDSAPGSGPETPWLLLWLLVVAATFVSWMALVASPRELARFAARRSMVLLTAAAAGAASVTAGWLSQTFLGSLPRVTFRCAMPIVSLLVPSVRGDIAASSIATDRIEVVIGAACSGYEGVGLTVVFVATWLYLFRQRLRFPRALLVLPVALATVWCLNIVRIAALVVLGHHVSPEIALGGFHSYAGSLLFVLANLALVFGALRVSWVCRDARGAEGFPAAVEPARENPVAAYLAPFLALVAVSLAISTFTSPGGREMCYPLRLALPVYLVVRYRARLAALLRFPSGLPEWTWSVTVGLAAAAIWIMLARAGEDTRPGPVLAGGSPGAILWWLARVAGAVAVIPLVEELAWRGWLLRRLVAADFAAVPWRRIPLWAHLAAAALFAVYHPHNLAGAAAAGLLYGGLASRRASLGPAVLAHATTNAAVFLWAAISGGWYVL